MTPGYRGNLGRKYQLIPYYSLLAITLPHTTTPPPQFRLYKSWQRLCVASTSKQGAEHKLRATFKLFSFSLFFLPVDGLFTVFTFYRISQFPRSSTLLVFLPALSSAATVLAPATDRACTRFMSLSQPSRCAWVCSSLSLLSRLWAWTLSNTLVPVGKIGI